MSYLVTPDDLYNQMKVYVTNSDTSKNSYIYNALYPTASELSYCLLLMDEVENKVFASKAVTSGYSDYLELRCSEIGITRKQAAYAKPTVTFTGKVGITISSGFIVSTNDNRQYTVPVDTVIGTTGMVDIIVTASDAGSLYNVKVGDINYMPVKISGITSVTNKKDYTDAYDKETDEELYARYLLKVQTPATSGNVYHYKEWCLECQGVGAVQVYPLKDETFQPKNGHVTCVIANSNKEPASSDLISTVKKYIDPNDGTGEGQAPIGATVHILSVTAVKININFSVQIDTSTTLDSVKSDLSTAVTTYLRDTAFATKKVNIAKIGSLILDIDGVLDYSNLKINNSTTNINLSEVQVGIIGDINIGVMS